MRRSRPGTCLPPSGCFLVYYWFDTQLPQQPPERSPGQPDEMPGTGERLRATTAETGFSGLWELSLGACSPTGRNHPALAFSFPDPSLKRIARVAAKWAWLGEREDKRTLPKTQGFPHKHTQASHDRRARWEAPLGCPPILTELSREHSFLEIWLECRLALTL